MTDASHAPVVRRLLVAVDASAASRAAIEAAAEIAAELGAEMTGLFVEDADLLRLGAHPAARLAASPGVAARAPRASEVEAAVRALTFGARRAVEDAARRARVRCTFRVTRGRVTSEVIAAAAGADLVCLGAASWSALGGGRLGSTARELIARSDSAVLVLRRRESLRRPVVVAWDGSDAARRAAAAAATLAAAGRAPLVVAAPAATGAEDAVAALCDAGVRATLHLVPRLGASELSRALRAVGGGVAVLPRAPGCDDLARALLADSDGAVLVAR